MATATVRVSDDYLSDWDLIDFGDIIQLFEDSDSGEEFLGFDVMDEASSSESDSDSDEPGSDDGGFSISNGKSRRVRTSCDV